MQASKASANPLFLPRLSVKKGRLKRTKRPFFFKLTSFREEENPLEERTKFSESSLYFKDDITILKDIFDEENLTPSEDLPEDKAAVGGPCNCFQGNQIFQERDHKIQNFVRILSKLYQE